MALGYSEYRRFEELVFLLLDSHGLQGVREAMMPSGRRADLILTFDDGSLVVVEVKLYGSPIVKEERIRRAVAVAEETRRSVLGRAAIVIISSRISERERTAIREMFANVLVFDLADIFYWASSRQEIYDDFRSFFFALSRDDEPFQAEIRRAMSAARARQRRHEPAIGDIAKALRTLGRPGHVEDVYDPDEGRRRYGKELCDTLRELGPGRPNAGAFERLVTDIVQYLFAENFSKWETQNVIDSGLRMDLCGKLFPRERFWKDVVRDFNCRYVVFEFKNYSNPISQEQVYSTEKYLLRDALRTLAIVISTKGADRGAAEASKGALREGGKLIVHLDIDELCEMLQERDDGGTPEKVLERKVDAMLMSLSR